MFSLFHQPSKLFSTVREMKYIKTLHQDHRVPSALPYDDGNAARTQLRSRGAVFHLRVLQHIRYHHPCVLAHHHQPRQNRTGTGDG